MNPEIVFAHSGRTDSSGGHNCNVGACAGTYHYHNGGSGYKSPVLYANPTSTPKPIATYRQLPTMVVPTITLAVEDTNISDIDSPDDSSLLLVAGGVISYCLYKLFHPSS